VHKPKVTIVQPPRRDLLKAKLKELETQKLNVLAEFKVQTAPIDAEMADLKQAIHDEENTYRQQLNEKLVKNIDLFLEFTPNHNGNCTDEKMGEYHGCARCDLLDIKKIGWVDVGRSIIIEVVDNPF